jgi:hypothetical protein
LVVPVVQNNGVRTPESCGLAHVIFQEPATPFSALHRSFTLAALTGRRKEEYVPFALMIPLVMKMLDILRQRMAELRFPKEDHP